MAAFTRSFEGKLPSGKSLKFLAVLAAGAVLASCSSSSSTRETPGTAAFNDYTINPTYAYAAVEDSGVALPQFDHLKMNERYHRKVVNFRGRFAPGTLVVDTTGPFLYYVQPGRKAIRYGIAVGKEGFEWAGDAQVKWKQKWPTWTPPAEMIARSPELKEFEDGMPAGITNPLGARAMYLFKDGKDTMYRIHGTNRPFSIGKKASSGCFRMINQDVIDLYERVKPGAKVIVRHGIPDLSDTHQV